MEQTATRARVARRSRAQDSREIQAGIHETHGKGIARVNNLDWICILVIAISMLSAAAMGFFMELFHLAGVLVGYILAAWEGWRLAPWFEPYVKSEILAKACGSIV